MEDRSSAELIEADRKQALREELDINPLSTKFVALAEVERSQGHLIDALHTLERGLIHHPKMSAARILRAEILSNLGRNKDAILELRQVLEFEPSNLSAFIMVGELLLTQRAYEEAARFLAIALRSKPEDKRLARLYQEAKSGGNFVQSNPQFKNLEPHKESQTSYQNWFTRFAFALGTLVLGALVMVIFLVHKQDVQAREKQEAAEKIPYYERLDEKYPHFAALRKARKYDEQLRGRFNSYDFGTYLPLLLDPETRKQLSFGYRRSIELSLLTNGLYSSFDALALPVQNQVDVEGTLLWLMRDLAKIGLNEETPIFRKSKEASEILKQSLNKLETLKNEIQKLPYQGRLTESALNTINFWQITIGTITQEKSSGLATQLNDLVDVLARRDSNFNQDFSERVADYAILYGDLALAKKLIPLVHKYERIWLRAQIKFLEQHPIRLRTLSLSKNKHCDFFPSLSTQWPSIDCAPPKEVLYFSDWKSEIYKKSHGDIQIDSNSQISIHYGNIWPWLQLHGQLEAAFLNPVNSNSSGALILPKSKKALEPWIKAQHWVKVLELRHAMHFQDQLTHLNLSQLTKNFIVRTSPDLEDWRAWELIARAAQAKKEQIKIRSIPVEKLVSPSILFPDLLYAKAIEQYSSKNSFTNSIEYTLELILEQYPEHRPARFWLAKEWVKKSETFEKGIDLLRPAISDIRKESNKSVKRTLPLEIYTDDIRFWIAKSIKDPRNEFIQEWLEPVLAKQNILSSEQKNEAAFMCAQSEYLSSKTKRTGRTKLEKLAQTHIDKELKEKIQKLLNK